MNRRGFLLGMLAAGVAPAIVRAANIMPIFARAGSGLLVPEQFVVTGVAGNTLLTFDLIAKESLKILEQNLKFFQKVGDEYGVAFGDFRAGDVITFRRPKA